MHLKGFNDYYYLASLNATQQSAILLVRLYLSLMVFE